MTSKPSQQSITVHILPNISQSEGHQTIKFDQLIEYNQINTFFAKTHAGNEADKIV